MTPDGGPLYAETNFGQFPVEPWATGSTLGLLLVSLYWSSRLQWRMIHPNKRLLSISVLLLYMAFIGALLYHAFRNHSFWLLLDFVPLALICLIVAIDSIVFGYRGRFYGLIGILLFLSLPVFVPALVSLRSTGYLVLALLTVPPLLMRCALQNWLGFKELFLTVGSFVIAVSFRELDFGIGQEVLPMGTHFLWHLFGASTFFWLFSFLHLHARVAKRMNP